METFIGLVALVIVMGGVALYLHLRRRAWRQLEHMLDDREERIQALASEVRRNRLASARAAYYRDHEPEESP